MVRVFFLTVTVVVALAGCGRPTAPTGVSGKGSDSAKVVELTPVDLEVKGPGLHKLQVQAPNGQTIKYVVHVPYFAKGMKVPLVVALHFAGKESDWYGHGMVQNLYAEGCMPIQAIIVAPDSLSGDDWVTPENADHVAWLTRSVVKSYPIDPKKVVLSGFSAGGIGTWSIATRVPGLFTAAIPIAGEPSGKASDWTIPVYAIHSEADSIVPPAATKRRIEELKAAGQKAEVFLLTDGTTHYQSDRYVSALRQACGMLQHFVWK